jgi:hypothetical protein
MLTTELRFGMTVRTSAGGPDTEPTPTSHPSGVPRTIAAFSGTHRVDYVRVIFTDGTHTEQPLTAEWTPG